MSNREKLRSRLREKKKPQAVAGLLIDEGCESTFRYEVIYDCPWCGREHKIKLIDNPPVEITPDCNMGLVNLHRIDVPEADDP